MRVGILGAGSIGCYIGAHLVRAEVATVLIGRQRLRDELATHGMRVTDVEGGDFKLSADALDVDTDPMRLGECDLILVTVKSADTAAAAAALSRLPEREGRCVISFQNGVRNADQLREVVRSATVLAGMVPWNVVWKAGAHFHRGTSGELMIEKLGTAAVEAAALLERAGLRTELRADLRDVLWGKLLLNLNNPVNALSGLPLRQQLATRGYRRIVAALMREALQVMRAADVRPAKAARLPPSWIPRVLDLPDALFLRVAGAMLRIDPEARSSMWEDLQRGRVTEVEFINGEVVRLARSIGRQAPLNQAMVALVREVETLPLGSSASYSAGSLAAALKQRGG